MSKKMKAAYRKKVQSYPTTTTSYSKKAFIWDYYLTDINKDGKAELLIKSGTCEADVKTEVFQYKNNKLKKTAVFYCAHSSFYHYSNGILMYTAHMGYESVSQIYFKNGKLQDAEITLHDTKGKPYQIILPYSLKSHVKYSSDYSRKWMDLKDLR